MAIDISGVTLPNVPANVLVRYPSAVILKMTSGDTTVYALLAATNFFGHATKNIISSMEHEEMLGSLGAGRAYYAQADASVWDVGSGEVAAGELMLPVGTVDNATVTLVWANHDVLEITSLDTSTGDYTTDGVYFAQTADTSTGTGNNDASIYRIRRSRLAGIGDQVRRLTEVSPDLTPEEIEAMLAELDITLEEAYVTPSTEQQEIYPSAYGFSKVIVEAVEDSGGTGGGGTPGEGGDDPGGSDTLLSADNATFGYEMVEQEVPTGRYWYGSVGPYYPPPNAYGYLILHGTSGGLASSTDRPLRYVSGNLYTNGPTNYDTYQYNKTTETWSLRNSGATTQDEGVLRTFITGRPTWANYVISSNVESFSGVYSEAVPETETKEVATPIEYEDTYTISGETMNDLGTIIQDLTGSSATTPDGMVSALETYLANQNPETTE